MYRSSPFRSKLNTGYITALDMREVCTEDTHSVAMWTRVTLQLWTCVKCTEAAHSVAIWTRVTLQLWTCVKYVPKQSILKQCEHGLHSSFGKEWNMYRSIEFCSNLNTGYITALDMCDVCTEAIHSVAIWTRVTVQLWTCVKYVPKQSIL